MVVSVSIRQASTSSCRLIIWFRNSPHTEKSLDIYQAVGPAISKVVVTVAVSQNYDVTGPSHCLMEFSEKVCKRSTTLWREQ
jgi:hypothetical protein